jgi:hypothetical protein
VRVGRPLGARWARVGRARSGAKKAWIGKEITRRRHWRDGDRQALAATSGYGWLRRRARREVGHAEWTRRDPRWVDLLRIPRYFTWLPQNAAPSFVRFCCLTTELEIADVQGGLYDPVSRRGIGESLTDNNL